jgi:hypothetical protein
MSTNPTDLTATTDPDAQSQADSDQQTLEQEQQQEGQAAASGDYSAAQQDATQAYEQSQTVAGEGGPDNTDATWNAMQRESWANWDQQTADQDQQASDSYAAAGDAQGAEVYGDAAGTEQGNADNSGEAGEYGDPVGEPADSTATADEAPADDTAVTDDTTATADTTATDDTTVDDDSSAS